MTNGDTKQFTIGQREEAKQFLEKIPHYPLDISVAGYYLKIAQIPYSVYLENLAKNNKEFRTVQKKLLKEAGDYIKTRYGIITLSLQHIMNSHADFGSLLLFVSLLDSQHIPKNLLDSYKNNVSLVDNFLFDLKKYSLIMAHSSPSSPIGSTFSIHRSTQEISLAYLTKVLNLEKNNQLFLSIAESLEKYIGEVIEREDLSKFRLLISHCEMFGNHTDLLTEELKRSVLNELGGVYLYLGNYERAKHLLEKSLLKINQAKSKNLGYARALTYLGNVYGDLGDHEKANLLGK